MELKDSRLGRCGWALILGPGKSPGYLLQKCSLGNEYFVELLGNSVAFVRRAETRVEPSGFPTDEHWPITQLFTWSFGLTERGLLPRSPTLFFTKK
ncbi:hypothetical protein I3760_16G080100 [Carya illinoinensis]|nr:hypothetical protein I3760_16G080100 [Carya illinoinensis]